MTSLEDLLYKSADDIRDSDVETHNAHVPSANRLNANMAFFTFTYKSVHIVSCRHRGKYGLRKPAFFTSVCRSVHREGVGFRVRG